MNSGSFHADSSASYNLAEIWPFPITGVDNGGLELRSSSLMHGLGHFGDRSVLAEGEMVAAGHRANYCPRKRRGDTLEADSPKLTSISGCGDFRNDGGSNSKRGKTAGSREDNTSSRVDAMEQKPQPVDAPKPDYIHVRARRGQATDSHSLAERARREKISERMKILQDLVPGCNKVIGKALVLDEIINYIQSLQRQVELLSMKLEAVSSRLNNGIDGFPSKDFGQQVFDATDVPFVSQRSTDYGRGASPEWLHMQIGRNFERTR